MSDAFWASLFGFLALLVGQWLTYRKAHDAEKKASEAKEESAVSRQQVKDDVVIAAKEVKTEAKEVAIAVENISNKQDEQSKVLNGNLTELKDVIAAAKLAEGILIGRQQLQAEIDAKLPKSPVPVTVVTTPDEPVDVVAHKKKPKQ